MAYQTDQVGKIIVVKNIVFPSSCFTKVQVDHAWRTGRPCVVLYSDDEYDYILPIKHEVRNQIYLYKYLHLDETKFLYQLGRDNRVSYKISKEKKITNSFINLEYIYKIPICGHTEVAKLTLPAYRELVDKYISLHRMTDLCNLSNDSQVRLCR